MCIDGAIEDTNREEERLAIFRGHKTSKMTCAAKINDTLKQLYHIAIEAKAQVVFKRSKDS